jgi:hypothetical protein
MNANYEATNYEISPILCPSSLFAPNILFSTLFTNDLKVFGLYQIGCNLYQLVLFRAVYLDLPSAADTSPLSKFLVPWTPFPKIILHFLK